MSLKSLMAGVLPAVVVLAAVIAIALSGLGMVVVSGDSMRPAMRTGDIAVYTKPAAIAVGDAVIYEPEAAAPVIHRIASREGTDSVRTRGDANTVMDREPLRVDRVRGRVVLVVPSGWLARVDWPARAATLLSQFDTRR